MKTLPLSQGRVALVDDRDHARASQFKWCLARRRNTDYAVSRRAGNGRNVYLHRFLLGAGRGDVAHLDGDGLNCQRENMSRVSHQVNLLGHQTPRKRKSSRFRGVSWEARKGKWEASATRLGKKHFLGYFEVESDAAAVFSAWSKQYLEGLNK